MSANVSVITKLNALVALVAFAMLALAGLGLAAQPEGFSVELALPMAGVIVVTLGLAVWLRLEVRKGILR